MHTLMGLFRWFICQQKFICEDEYSHNHDWLRESIVLYAVLCGSSLCFLRQIIRLIILFPCKHNVYLIVITQIKKINEIYWWDFIWCIHSLMHWNDKCKTFFPKSSQTYVLYYSSNYHLEYLYELYGLLVGNDSNTNLIIFLNNNLQQNISLILFQIALQYLVRPIFCITSSNSVIFIQFAITNEPLKWHSMFYIFVQ